MCLAPRGSRRKPLNHVHRPAYSMMMTEQEDGQPVPRTDRPGTTVGTAVYLLSIDTPAPDEDLKMPRQHGPLEDPGSHTRSIATRSSRSSRIAWSPTRRPTGHLRPVETEAGGHRRCRPCGCGMAYLIGSSHCLHCAHHLGFAVPDEALAPAS